MSLKPMIKGTALGAAVVSTMMLAGCGGSGTKSIGSINGKPVTQDEMYTQMVALPVLAGQNEQGQPVFSSAGAEALKAMINNQAVLDLATKKKAVPTDKEVSDEIDRLKRMTPELIGNLNKQGRTVEDLRRQVRVQLAQLKIMEQGINVTEKEIEDQYQVLLQNPQAGYRVPETYELRIILSRDAAKNAQADKELSSGKDFVEVAKKYMHPAYAQFSQNEARLGNPSVPRDFLVAAFNAPTAGQPATENGRVKADAQGQKVLDAIKAAGPGKVTPWIQFNGRDPQNPSKTQVEYVKFRVDKITPEKTTPLNADSKVDIRRQVIATKADRTALQKELLKAAVEAKADFKTEPYKGLYDQIKKQLQEQLKALDAASPAAPGAPGTPTAPGATTPGATPPAAGGATPGATAPATPPATGGGAAPR